MNKKQKIIISILGLALIILLVIILSVNQKKEDKKTEQIGDIFVPELMTDEERQSRDLLGANDIQVIKRGEDGQTEIYRIIRPGQEIINPADVEAIN